MRLPSDFDMREYQYPLWDYMAGGGKRAVCVWHRRAGKDLLCANWAAYDAARSPGNYWHMFPLSIQGRTALWNKVDNGRRVVDQIFPSWYVAGKNDQAMTIKLTTGSTWQILGSDNYENSIGANPRGIVFSEWSLTNPQAWEYMRPILRENGGWAIFIFTPRWLNHGWDMYKLAQQQPDWFCQLLTVRDTGFEHLAKAEMRDGMPEDLARQEYYCFPEGTLVATAAGHVPIERVRDGDYVRTHTGRMRPVIGTSARDIDEEIVEIKTAGDTNPLLCTEAHPIRVIDHASQTYEWRAAGDVVVGDSLVLPKLRTGKPVISRELAILVAWYICEGSVSKTAVNFSLGREPMSVAEIVNAAWSFGAKASIAYQGEVSQVQVRSTQLADFLASSCGRGSENKRIPFHLIAGHEKAVFDAMIEGDGCVGDYGGVQAVYTTVSRGLAYDVQMLAHALGYRAGIVARPGGPQVIQGRDVECRDSYQVRIDTRPHRNLARCEIRPAKNGVGVKVKSVSRRRYAGPVFNLHVSGDESYVANGRIVHNCSFTALNHGSIYGKDLEVVERDKRITKVAHDPYADVHAYFDLGWRDATAIWWVQYIGNAVHLIDYAEDSFKTPRQYAEMLRGEAEGAERRKAYRYASVCLPHDARQHHLSAGGVSVEEQFRDFGFPVEIVGSKPITDRGFTADRINAVRRILPLCFFDANNTNLGVKALQSYVRKWDEERKVFSDRPEHDWSSHGCDAFGLMAIDQERQRLARAPKRRAIVYPDDHISNMVI